MSPLARVRCWVESGQLKDPVHPWIRVRGQDSLNAVGCVNQDHKDCLHDVENRGHRGAVGEPIAGHDQLLAPDFELLPDLDLDVGGDDQSQQEEIGQCLGPSGRFDVDVVDDARIGFEVAKARLDGDLPFVLLQNVVVVPALLIQKRRNEDEGAGFGMRLANALFGGFGKLRLDAVLG